MIRASWIAWRLWSGLVLGGTLGLSHAFAQAEGATGVPGTGDAVQGEIDHTPSVKDGDGAERVKLHIVVVDRTGSCDPPPTAPVKGGSVFVRWRTDDGEQERRKLTDTHGEVDVSAVPQGKIAVQVVAEGYLTFSRGLALTPRETPLCIKLTPFDE